MGVRVPIEGLDVWLPPLDQGALLLLEGTANSAPRFVAHRFCAALVKEGRSVVWAAPNLPKGRYDPSPPAANGTGNGKQGGRVRPLAAGDWQDLAGRGRDDDIVIDSLSILGLRSNPEEFAGKLLALRRDLEKTGRIGIAILETGALGQEKDAIARHVSEAIIQFRVREDPDSYVQFLRVPKWTTGGGLVLNIYFNFDGRNLLVDTRKRVV